MALSREDHRRAWTTELERRVDQAVSEAGTAFAFIRDALEALQQGPKPERLLRTRRKLQGSQRLTVYTPAALVERLHAVAFEQRRSVSDIVCEATVAWLDDVAK